MTHYTLTIVFNFYAKTYLKMFIGNYLYVKIEIKKKISDR